jgi:hypothetical protein
MRITAVVPLALIFASTRAAPETVNARPSTTISIEAGIVYTTGPQPVAREEFRLLRQSLKQIAARVHRSAEYQTALAAEGKSDDPPATEEVTDESAATEQAINRVMRPFRELVASKPIGTKLRLMDGAINQATADSMITGFDGKGRFRPVPAGSYFVFGITKLRDGRYSVWCVPVIAKSPAATVILDQNNLMIVSKGDE